MKRFLFPFLLAVIVFLTGCTHKENDKQFVICKKEFNVVKDRALQLENGDYDFTVEKNAVLSVYRFSSNNQKINIEFSEAEIKSINTIRESISYDFSFIRVTDDSIIYGGIGPEVYVYSKNGEPPKYFLSEEKKKFKTYEIDTNWYRLLFDSYYFFP